MTDPSQFFSSDHCRVKLNLSQCLISVGPLFYKPQTRSLGSKFLNSGCIAGIAKHMKDMFNDVVYENNVINDDQQVFVRYMLGHTHMIGLDSSHRLFLTGYREFTSNDNSIQIYPDLSSGVTIGNRFIDNVPVFHFNNMKSYGGVYHR